MGLILHEVIPADENSQAAFAERKIQNQKNWGSSVCPNFLIARLAILNTANASMQDPNIPRSTG
jgi:hypothetical protein